MDIVDKAQLKGSTLASLFGQNAKNVVIITPKKQLGPKQDAKAKAVFSQKEKNLAISTPEKQLRSKKDAKECERTPMKLTSKAKPTKSSSFSKRNSDLDKKSIVHLSKSCLMAVNASSGLTKRQLMHGWFR